MNYKIKIEGQEIDMPEEIAGDDASLKSALAPYFPGAANAKFMRSEEKDGVITVTVVKQAGTKGAKAEFKKPVGTNTTIVIFDEYRRLEDSGRIKAVLDQFLHNSPTDQVLRKMIDAPACVNPVVELHRSLEGKTFNQMTVDQLLELDDQIDEIIQSGLKEKSAIDTSLALITKIAPISSKVVPVGF
jgi:hypothetical protein